MHCCRAHTHTHTLISLFFSTILTNNQPRLINSDQQPKTMFTFENNSKIYSNHLNSRKLMMKKNTIKMFSFLVFTLTLWIVYIVLTFSFLNVCKFDRCLRLCAVIFIEHSSCTCLCIGPNNRRWVKDSKVWMSRSIVSTNWKIYRFHSENSMVRISVF